MIKKLRRKFILIAMLSIVMVITTIIASINIANFTKLVKDSNRTVDVIYNQKDMFKPNNNMHGPNEFGPEMKFQTRYFIIYIDDDKNVISYDLSHIARTDETQIDYYKTKALSNKNDLIDDYYCKIIDNQIIFLDCGRELDSFRSFLTISSLISVAGCLIIFLLIIILSKIAVRPFYINEEKQKKFISDASHELKTPLTIINADVEILELTNGESEWTESIKKQTSRLANITKQMTSLAKLEELKYEFKSVNISRLLLESINDISILFNNSKINHEIQENIEMMGNEDLIKELFFTLLENANKYSQGDVNISLSKHNKNVNIVFSNEVELEDGNYDCMFDRFYRLDSSRNSNVGGSGLGLAIAKGIVEFHNGSIKASVKDNILSINIIFTAPGNIQKASDLNI